MIDKGIIHITGENDVGKTLAALTLCHPSETVYFFDDVKPPPIDEKEFMGFVDQVNEMTMLQMRDEVLSIIEDIKSWKKKPKCIVFDTWSRFGNASRLWAKNNTHLFREKETLAPGKKYLWGQQAGEAHRYEAYLISELSKIADYVVLVTHLKGHYIADTPTGKQVADAGKSFDRVCNLRLWLRNNPDSGVPIILVLKRLSSIKLTKTGIEPINVLPRKITPVDGETTVWQCVDRYWKEPIGNRKPSKDETPTEFELSILDGTLTADQKEAWRANLATVTVEQAVSSNGHIKTLLQEMKNEGQDMDDLLEVEEKLGVPIDMGEMVEMIKGLK